MPDATKASRAANLRALFRVYKRNARKRDLPVSISLARFAELTKLPCFCCGAKPANRYRHSLKTSSYRHPYIYNGIDRVSSRKGYTDDNCAPCCSKCNYAKGSLTLERFLLHVFKVYQHAIEPALEARHVEPDPPE